MRLIIGGPNCPTSPLSQLIYIISKLFIIHIKSYFKDNLDFLRKCSQKINDSTTLVMFDVKSKYPPSTPHNYNLEGIRFWIEKNPDSFHSRFCTGKYKNNIRI